MTTSSITNTVERLRKLVSEEEWNHLSDGELLRTFLSDRSAEAFTRLVERHGSMVFGVCLRILHHHQDAEDAFQATFIVLARKAGSVNPSDAVGNWLYGVAYRVASKARSRRRQLLLQENPSLDEIEAKPLAEITDWMPILDQELNHLTERDRLAILLCDLEGRSRKDAAIQLGISEGTLSSRLARARERLRDRLLRRGIAPLVAANVVGLALESSAKVPLDLVERTIQSSFQPLKKSTASSIAYLVEGVIRTMLWRQIQKFGIILISLMTLMGIGIWLHDPVQAAIEPLSKEDLERIKKEFEANATDLELLQGNWVIAHVQSDNPKDKLWSGIVYIITVDRLFPITGMEKVGSRPKGLPFRLDPTTPVKQIDLLDSPKQKTSSIPGIYRFKDNRLEICTSSDGAPRPKEFSAPNGSKRTLVILKRQDEPEKNPDVEKIRKAQTEALARQWEATLNRVRFRQDNIQVLTDLISDWLKLKKLPELQQLLYGTILKDLNDLLQDWSKPDPGETEGIHKQIEPLKRLIALIEAKKLEEFPVDPSANLDAQKRILARRWKDLLDAARTQNGFDSKLTATLEGIIADHLKLTQSGKDRQALFDSIIANLEEVLDYWNSRKDDGKLTVHINQLRNLITQIKEARQKEFPTDLRKGQINPTNDPNAPILNPKVLLQLVENNTKRWEAKLKRVDSAQDTVSSLLEDVRNMLIAELQGRSKAEDRLKIYQTWAKRLIDFKKQIDDNSTKWSHTPNASEQVWQTIVMIDAWAKKEIPEEPILKGSDPVGANNIQPKESRRDPNPEIRKLLERRAALLEKNIEPMWYRFKLGRETMDECLKVIDDLAETELELARENKDRIRVLEKNLKYLSEAKTLLDELVKSGSRAPQFADLLEARILKAQIRLEKEKEK